VTVKASSNVSVEDANGAVIGFGMAVGVDATGTYEVASTAPSLASVTTEVVWLTTASQITTLAYAFIRANGDILVEVKGDAADKIMGFVVKAGFPFLISGEMMPEGIAGGAEAITQIQVRNDGAAAVVLSVVLVGT